MWPKSYGCWNGSVGQGEECAAAYTICSFRASTGDVGGCGSACAGKNLRYAQELAETRLAEKTRTYDIHRARSFRPWFGDGRGRSRHAVLH